jgi:putative membrane protein
MKRFFKLFLQGIVMGFALITAIGGGTIAVLMGIYDDMVFAVADFTKNPKKSISFLGPILLGVFTGVAVLIYPIKLFLEFAPFVATSLFVGLTLGGLYVFKETTHKKSNTLNIILLILGFLLVAGIGVVSWFNSSASTLDIGLVGNIFFLAIIGFFASSALVAPGISGTLFLLSIGYFNYLLDLAKKVLLFEQENWWTNFGLLASFGIGLLIGFFVISKLFKYLLTKHRTATYFTILGWIIGSMVICYFNGDIKNAYLSLEGFEIWTLVFSLLALGVGALISFSLLKFVSKKEENLKLEQNTERGDQNDAVGN